MGILGWFVGLLPSQGSCDPKSAPDSFGCLDGSGSDPGAVRGAWWMLGMLSKAISQILEELDWLISDFWDQTSPPSVPSWRIPCTSSCIQLQIPSGRATPVSPPWGSAPCAGLATLPGILPGIQDAPSRCVPAHVLPLPRKTGTPGNVWSWDFGIKQDKWHRESRGHPGVCCVPLPIPAPSFPWDL